MPDTVSGWPLHSYNFEVVFIICDLWILIILIAMVMVGVGGLGPYTVNPKGVGAHPQGWSILHTLGCKYAPSSKGV